MWETSKKCLKCCLAIANCNDHGCFLHYISHQLAFGPAKYIGELHVLCWVAYSLQFAVEKTGKEGSNTHKGSVTSKV